MIRLDVKNKDPYEVVADFVCNYFGWYAPAIVDLETENVGRSNELILPDTESGSYCWENDWYEGGSEVIIHGLVDVHDVDVPEVQK